MLDVARARADLRDKSRGYCVVRGLYSPEEIEAYRGACERSMDSGLRIHERIISDTIADYVHPRSHDHEQRTARLYQYFHNHRDDMIGQMLGRALALRDAVEQEWLVDDAYRSERATLVDYVIVTKYLGNKGMLTKHADYYGPAPLPLVQFWAPLSKPGVDYEGGNLILYSKDGSHRRVETDLGISLGDAVMFDKSLFHEVELTRTPEAPALGRWSVLIGARAPRDSRLGAVRKRWLYGPPLYHPLSQASRTMKRLGRALGLRPAG